MIKYLRLLLTNPILFLKKVCGRFIWLYKLYILKDLYHVEKTKWLKDKGDETLRHNYPELNENSIVFDLGGYVGDFTQTINDKYGCKVFLFEPHPKFYATCVERFANNKNVTLLNFGISDADGQFLLSDNVDSSSFLSPSTTSKKSIVCKVREILSVLEDLNIKKIDLMKINIEGGEYPLLIHLAKLNSLDLVEEYQIQFHNFIPDAIPKRDNIIEYLSQTHKRTWCYYFVWENWKKFK